MAVLKVIEVLAESNENWEAAAKEAVAEASKSVHNIQSIYIKEFQAIVEGNQIVKYRINGKISFIVEEKK